MSVMRPDRNINVSFIIRHFCVSNSKIFKMVWPLLIRSANGNLLNIIGNYITKQPTKGGINFCLKGNLQLPYLNSKSGSLLSK